MTLPKSNENTSSDAMSSTDSNDDDEDFFDKCFAIEASAIEIGDTLRRNHSISSADSDGEGDGNEVLVTFSAIRTLQATFRGVAYSVNYLDLTEEEAGYFKLIDVNCSNITLSVERNHIVIDDNSLSIERLRLPANPQNDAVSEMTKTEWIFFSECEPLMAKYEQKFYFVHENLKNEYETLLKISKKAMGTAIRVKKQRIDANRVENVLNIIKSDVQSGADQTIYLYQPKAVNGGEMHSECDDRNQQWQRYLINQDNELVPIDDGLLFNVIESIDEYDNEHPIDEQMVMELEKEDDGENDEDTNSEISSLSSEDGCIPELKMMRLPKFEVSNPVRQLIRDGANEELSGKICAHTQSKTLLNRAKHDDYEEIVSCMIDLEDEVQAVFTEKFSQPNIKLTNYMERVFYFPIEPRHAELAAAVEEKYVDFVKLIAETESKRSHSYDGRFWRKADGKIFIQLSEFENCRNLNTSHTYYLHCVSNRFTFQVTKLCQKFCARDELIPLLLYNPDFYKRKKPEAIKNKIELTGSIARNLNREQKLVVSNILQKCSYPLPFILFGPPGTGKTRTLVAAIEEIIKTTDQYVLVCATSNSACDEIAERLLSVVEDEDDMFRMFARSVPPEKVCPRLKRVSNVRHGKHFNPALKILYRYRVVITTLCTSSNFARAYIDAKYYDPKHFSYVFIDECSSAPEVLQLVPIAGVCSTFQKIEAQIVLAGDPKQLGPVIRDRRAKALGYEISYIDRLMNYELYKMDSMSGKFNYKYIVQLVKNYRSHNAILRVPNDLFYGGKLVAKANKDVTDCFIGHHLLPNKEIPIIFHSIQGTCEVLPGECSAFNTAEIEQVLLYVKKLLPNRAYFNPKDYKITAEDIGIVTPYRKQCQKIRDRLKQLGFSEIVVGSAEVFQGKEKPVMIVSTVRSGGVELGFVKDRRRLNVMITRAKSLLIIVGNPFTLSNDKNWAKMVKYCDKSKAIIHNKVI